MTLSRLKEHHTILARPLFTSCIRFDPVHLPLPTAPELQPTTPVCVGIVAAPPDDGARFGPLAPLQRYSQFYTSETSFTIETLTGRLILFNYFSAEKWLCSVVQSSQNRLIILAWKVLFMDQYVTCSVSY